MKVGNQYIIPFKGLKTGKHTFNFEIGKEFFEEYSELEISDGLINSVVDLEKKTNLLLLNIKLSGFVKLQCDRCLDTFDYKIAFEGQLFVKFKETPEEPDDKVIFLHPNDDILDLAQYFYDNIGLSIPIQRYHPDDAKGIPACNKKMLNILGAYTDKNIIEHKDIDPRWSKLKDLLNDDNKNE